MADHLGWAVAVAASPDHAVVDRRRVELVEPGVTAAPIHYESRRLDVAGTAALVAAVRASVGRAASAALDQLVAAVRASVGRAASAALDRLAAALAEPVVSISLRRWPLAFPEDIAVQRRSPWEVHLFDAVDEGPPDGPRRHDRGRLRRARPGL